MDYLQYKTSEAAPSAAESVLNLVINGLPSIHELRMSLNLYFKVLNLVINGLPSILYVE